MQYTGLVTMSVQFGPCKVADQHLTFAAMRVDTSSVLKNQTEVGVPASVLSLIPSYAKALRIEIGPHLRDFYGLPTPVSLFLFHNCMITEASPLEASKETLWNLLRLLFTISCCTPKPE
jgi:hypothetical protein